MKSAPETDLGARSPQVRASNMSTMRKFLTETPVFTWPNNEITFVFREHPSETWLEWERQLSPPGKGGSAFVDQYRVRENMYHEINFPEPFADKELVSYEITANEANKEVEAMTDLRHPHVAALLGTYQFRNRLHLLIFPAGCCDLGDFMLCISNRLKLRKADWKPDPPAEGTYNSVEIIKVYSRPYRECLQDQLRWLEKYFCCLCQALSYLHENNIRHKDIKPENILIDTTGNVIVMDFGISTKFEPTASHTTRGPGQFCTERYKPPEMKPGGIRDDRSDVWSLGCVFLEMVSLLLGFDLDALDAHFGKRPGDNPQPVFCDHIDEIQSWLAKLESRSLDGSRFRKHYLPAIRKMLNKDKEGRSTSQNLWKEFDFLPKEDRCQDCHPAHGAWSPNDDQRQRLTDGNIVRRRMNEDEDKRVSQEQNQALLDGDREMSRVHSNSLSNASSSKGSGKRYTSIVKSTQGSSLGITAPTRPDSPQSWTSSAISIRPKSPTPLGVSNEMPQIRDPADIAHKTPHSKQAHFSPETIDMDDGMTNPLRGSSGLSRISTTSNPAQPPRLPSSTSERDISTVNSTTITPAPSESSESLYEQSTAPQVNNDSSSLALADKSNGVLALITMPSPKRLRFPEARDNEIVIKYDLHDNYHLSFVTFKQIKDSKMVGFRIPTGRYLDVFSTINVLSRIDTKSVGNILQRILRRFQGFTTKGRKLYIVNFADSHPPTHLRDVETQKKIEPG